MKLSVFITGLLFILFSFNVQGQCPTTNLVENPGQFQWTFHPASATIESPAKRLDRLQDHSRVCTPDIQGS